MDHEATPERGGVLKANDVALFGAPIKTDKIYFITQDNDIISVYDIDIVTAV